MNEVSSPWWPRSLTSCQGKQTLLFLHRNVLEPAAAEALCAARLSASLLTLGGRSSFLSVKCVQSAVTRSPASRCSYNTFSSDLCMTILTCDPPPSLSHQAFCRGQSVDELREVDEGRRHRNGRSPHDGDVLGVVAPAPVFFHLHRLHFRNYLGSKPPSVGLQSRTSWEPMTIISQCGGYPAAVVGSGRWVPALTLLSCACVVP